MSLSIIETRPLLHTNTIQEWYIHPSSAYFVASANTWRPAVSTTRAFIQLLVSGWSERDDPLVTLWWSIMDKSTSRFTCRLPSTSALCYVHGRQLKITHLKSQSHSSATPWTNIWTAESQQKTKRLFCELILRFTLLVSVSFSVSTETRQEGDTVVHCSSASLELKQRIRFVWSSGRRNASYWNVQLDTK